MLNRTISLTARVMTVMALVVLAAAALCACESHEGGKTQTVTIEAAPEAAEETADDEGTAEEADDETDAESGKPSQLESSTEVESTAEPAPEPAAQEQPAGGSTIVNLDDPAQYQQINLFLSNFSEVYMRDNPFDVSTASDIGLASFAMWHTYRNSPSLVEQGSYGGDLYRYNIRITQDRANEIAQRYFGRSIDFGTMASMDQEFYCADGYVYTQTTNGAGMPEGITLARSATDVGGGCVRIDFDIYFPNAAYDTGDMSLYASTPAEIESRWGVSGPYRTGSAVVHYGDYNDYTGGLYLDSWEAESR